MKENTKKGVTRREFLGLSALGLASLTILPSWAVNGVRIAPSDRVVLGFVGLGQQGLRVSLLVLGCRSLPVVTWIP